MYWCPVQRSCEVCRFGISDFEKQEAQEYKRVHKKQTTTSDGCLQWSHPSSGHTGANGSVEFFRECFYSSLTLTELRSRMQTIGVSLLRIFDTAGYGRIRQDTAGYGRIRQDTAGYGRIRQDTAGYGRIRQDTAGYAGYGRIRQDTAGYGRYGRIQQDTAGYGRIRQGPKYLLVCTTKTTILRSFSVRR